MNLFQATHSLLEEALLDGWRNGCPLQLENRPRTVHQGEWCAVEVCWGFNYRPACAVTGEQERLDGRFFLRIFVPANEGMTRANQLAGFAADILAHKTWQRGPVVVETDGATIGNKEQGEDRFSMMFSCAFKSRSEGEL